MSARLSPSSSAGMVKVLTRIGYHLQERASSTGFLFSFCWLIHLVDFQETVPRTWSLYAQKDFILSRKLQWSVVVCLSKQPPAKEKKLLTLIWKVRSRVKYDKSGGCMFRHSIESLRDSEVRSHTFLIPEWKVWSWSGEIEDSVFCNMPAFLQASLTVIDVDSDCETRRKCSYT